VSCRWLVIGNNVAFPPNNGPSSRKQYIHFPLKWVIRSSLFRKKTQIAHTFSPNNIPTTKEYMEGTQSCLVNVLPPAEHCCRKQGRITGGLWLTGNSWSRWPSPLISRSHSLYTLSHNNAAEAQPFTYLGNSWLSNVIFVSSTE